MGMSMYTFHLSWFVYYSLIVLIYSVFWTAVTKQFIAKTANVVLYFFLYFLTGEYMLCLAIFLSSFFSRAKPGVLTAILTFLFLFGVTVSKAAISGKDLSVNTWFSLSPFAGLLGACDIVLLTSSYY